MPQVDFGGPAQPHGHGHRHGDVNVKVVNGETQPIHIKIDVDVSKDDTIQHRESRSNLLLLACSLQVFQLGLLLIHTLMLFLLFHSRG